MMDSAQTTTSNEALAFELHGKRFLDLGNEVLTSSTIK